MSKIEACLVIAALVLIPLGLLERLKPASASPTLATPQIQEAGRILGIDATSPDGNAGFGNQAKVILELAYRVKALEERK